MRAYAKFSEDLEGLLDTLEWGRRMPPKSIEIHNYLNGGASEILWNLVEPEKIWLSGAFFTPEKLARRALKIKTFNILPQNCIVLDPGCGAGDLLLHWAESLPVRPSLEETLANWNNVIRGFDIHPEFIDVAKRRLILLALMRGAVLQAKHPPKISSLFIGIRHSDFLMRKSREIGIDYIIMNPPFTSIPAPEGCEWTSGNVNAAAVFMERALQHLDTGKCIIAILPDVLRSGSRYGYWRKIVSQKLCIKRCEPWGRFSKNADVDVFILEGITSSNGKFPEPWIRTRGCGTHKCINDVASVSVGPVVPHRHHQRGNKVPFVTVCDLPAWKTVKRVKGKRRFSGTLFKPPFVAVRRTSSPRDANRAIATIVHGQEPIAVENHLIVLQPQNRIPRECKRILKSLKDHRTTNWLNHRIRCRHLTVGVLKELPLFGD
jgi:hypothetical protein